MNKNTIKYLDVRNKNNEYIYSENLTLKLKNKLNINNEKNIYEKKIDNEELSFTQICDIPLPDPTKDENIIFEIEDKEKHLNKLIQDSKDWSLTDEEHTKIINETKFMENRIKELKKELLNLNNEDNDIQHNISIKINGINIENVNFDDIFNLNNYNLGEKEQKIINTIENMKEDIKIYNKKIKESIKYTINDDYFKILLISNLNKIETMINLFEDNYNDIQKLIS